MASLLFPVSNFRPSSGYQYSYIHIQPTQANKPYILFLHGFPSSSHEWRHQINHFSALGYGIVAPDLLGFGLTDHPIELEPFHGKNMVRDILELLDTIKIDGKIHGVGHDFGSHLMSRLAVLAQGRFLTLSFLAVGYVAPGRPFNVDTINSITKQKFGYPIFAYMKFFGADPEANQVVNEHADSLMSWTFSKQYPKHPGDDPRGLRGDIKSWLLSNQKEEFPEWWTTEDQALHRQFFSQEGGYSSSLNWYRAVVNDINFQHEKDIEPGSVHLKVPVLLLLSRYDYTALPAIQEANTKPYVENLTVHTLETAHWIQLERPQEVNQKLEEFFGDGFKDA